MVGTYAALAASVPPLGKAIAEQMQKVPRLRQKLAFGDTTGLQAPGFLLEGEPFGQDGLLITADQFSDCACIRDHYAHFGG